VRINSAKLLVTDSDGNPVPRASVKLEWSNTPAAPGSTGFAPVVKTFTSSRSNAAKGTLTVRSPYAASPPITLRVLLATGRLRAASPLFTLDYPASDVATEFSWS